MSDGETTSHTFVVRIWLEARDPPVWRGHVTHVTTGERAHFADLRQLLDVITAFTRARSRTDGDAMRADATGGDPQ